MSLYFLHENLQLLDNCFILHFTEINCNHQSSPQSNLAFELKCLLKVRIYDEGMKEGHKILHQIVKKK